MSLGALVASIVERRRRSAQTSYEQGAQIKRRLQELLQVNAPTQKIETVSTISRGENEPAVRAHSWQVIAQQTMQENDPAQLQALAKKLNEAMLTEERERVRRRFGFAPATQSLASVPVSSRDNGTTEV